MGLRSILRVSGLERKAKGQLDLDPVVKYLHQGDTEEALKALDDLLNDKLDVRVAPKREGFVVTTDWFHAILPEDQRRFMWFVQTLANVRERLFGFMDEHDRRQSIEKSIADLQAAKREDVPWVEDLMRGDEDVFKHGPYTVVLAPYVSRDAADECLQVLDAATAKVSARFPQVAYGKVVVRRDPKPAGTYDKYPGGSIAGSYVATRDHIVLSLYSRPDRNSIMTLIHELGHRYHTRFLDHEKREKFKELHEVGNVQREKFPLPERLRAADEHLALWELHRSDEFPDPDSILSERSQLWTKTYPRDEYKKQVVPLYRKFLEGDDSVREALHKALALANLPGKIERVVNNPAPEYASTYGMTSWEENFADAFLATCIGKSLPPGLQAFMDAL